MIETTGHELLADYARTGSEAAFAQLVARYINLVHSAAQRYTGNEAQAGEITQAVFLILARKAGSLSKNIVLAGWLYQTTRVTAANALKAEARRQLRDHQAYMESQVNRSDAAVWREIAPLLDDAMGKLGETDRTVLVLRFFEGRTNAETAAALGLAEGAVQKRVQRALEKLRATFAKQGVTHTAQAIAGSVNRYAVLAAPAGLMALICANAAQGAIIATSITALANGTLKTLAMTTIQKTLITATLIASVGTGLYEAKENAQARAEVRTLQQQQSPLAEQIQQLQLKMNENARAGQPSDAETNELFQLRNQINALQQVAKENIQLKLQNDNLSKQIQAGAIETITNKPTDGIPGVLMARVKSRFIRNWGDAVRDYAKDHAGQLPSNLTNAISYLHDNDIMRAEASVYGFEFDGFDLLCQVQLADVKDRSHTILIREKQLWRYENIHPVWALEYLFVDDHTCTATSPSGAWTDFEAFEKGLR